MPHFLFVVWLQKGLQMDKDYIIFQDNGLFGAKNQRGEVIIPPQYMEMYSFSCGLSMVRNHQYQYAYIDVNNKQVIPFGKYSWCDPQFTCGFSRVMKYHYFEEKNKWGIIDTLGNIVVPLKYDKIWAIKEEYLFSIKAFLDDKEERINLHQLANKVIFDGLTYICIYSVEAFKELVHCRNLYVKFQPNTRQLYFTYGANIGFVSLSTLKEPIISIVADSSGKIFPLMMEKSDIGKTTLPIAKVTPKQAVSKTTSHKTSFEDYEYEADNWSDIYEEEQAFYDDCLSDAYEGDPDARWNTD